MYNESEKQENKAKIRTLVDTITISDTYTCGRVENVIIDALSEQGFEIDIVQKNIAGLPSKRELNIYEVR